MASLAEQTVLTKEEQVKVDTNQSAWTYLILSCKENAFSIVASVNDVDAHQAWIRLKEVVAPNKVIDLVVMNQGFTNLRLEDDEEDPKLYVNKLEHKNERYESVDRKYKKDDLEMITLLMNYVRQMLLLHIWHEIKN
jgi:hypothetical protein